MSIFIDTSAIIAVLDGDDSRQQIARETWDKLLSSGESLVASNYVLTEIVAVAQRKLGFNAVRTFRVEARPALEVIWVDQPIHDAAEVRLLLSGRRDLSLVDCVSFELMRQRGISRAFTFDPHFAEQGFECLPG